MSDVPLRALLLRCGVACVVLFAALCVSRHFVSTGMRWRSVQAYLLATVDRGVFVSPAGTSRVYVVSNDAGAMHSGYFWTWLFVGHPLLGKRLIGEGYLEDSQGRVPLEWEGEKRLKIGFVSGRYSREPGPQAIRAPPAVDAGQLAADLLLVAGIAAIYGLLFVRRRLKAKQRAGAAFDRPKRPPWHI